MPAKSSADPKLHGNPVTTCIPMAGDDLSFTGPNVWKSQIQRIVWVGRDPSRPSGPTPLHWTGTPTADQVLRAPSSLLLGVSKDGIHYLIANICKAVSLKIRICYWEKYIEVSTRIMCWRWGYVASRKFPSCKQDLLMISWGRLWVATGIFGLVSISTLANLFSPSLTKERWQNGI